MRRRTLTTWSVATLSALGLTACSFTQSVTPSGNETPSGPLERGERYDVVFEVENYSYISWDPTNERLIAAHSDTTVSRQGTGLTSRHASIHSTFPQTIRTLRGATPMT